MKQINYYFIYFFIVTQVSCIKDSRFEIRHILTETRINNSSIPNSLLDRIDYFAVYFKNVKNNDLKNRIENYVKHSLINNINSKEYINYSVMFYSVQTLSDVHKLEKSDSLTKVNFFENNKTENKIVSYLYYKSDLLNKDFGENFQ